MHYSVSPKPAERRPPTFWPLLPQDDARMSPALEASEEEENRRLKTLVIRLAKVILRMS